MPRTARQEQRSRGQGRGAAASTKPNTSASRAPAGGSMQLRAPPADTSRDPWPAGSAAHLWPRPLPLHAVAGLVQRVQHPLPRRRVGGLQRAPAQLLEAGAVCSERRGWVGGWVGRVDGWGGGRRRRRRRVGGGVGWWGGVGGGRRPANRGLRLRWSGPDHLPLCCSYPYRRHCPNRPYAGVLQAWPSTHASRLVRM